MAPILSLAGYEESQRIWEQALDRKKEDLDTLLKSLERKRKKNDISSIPVVGLDEAIQFGDMDAFQGAVQRLATQFKTKNVTTLLSKHVYPTLDNVRYFKTAISSISQAEPTGAGSLIFGLLFIVVQCGCIFAESIEQIMEELGVLQNTLPSVQRDVYLYPRSRELKFKLRDIFDDYVDFCVVIIRYTARRPLVALLQILKSSGLRHDLKKLTTKLKRHVDDFDRAVTQAERGRSIEADEQIQEGINLLAKQASTSQSASYPPPGKFPLHSINIAENPCFVGRESQLKKLHKLLVDDHKGAEPVACALYGNPGVGKTQMALRFTYQHRAEFDAVFWVSAAPDQGTETLRTFGNIGRRLGLFKNEEIDDAQVEIVLGWLQTAEQRWCLVFDNVVDWKSIARYWPNTSQGPCAIIVTAQKATPWIPETHQLAVDYLDDVDGSELLLRQAHISEQDVEDDQRRLAREISTELGGCPLYLSLAQGFMALSQTTLEEYLDLVRIRSNVLGNRSTNQWMYDRAADATHDSLIKTLDPGAVDLLYMLSFMNPENVSEGLLLIDHDDDSLDFLRDKPTYLSYVAQLVEGQLVQRDGAIAQQISQGSRNQRYLRMHRSTREAMLLRLNNSDHTKDREAAFERVIRLLREHFPPPSKLQIANAQVWPRLTKILPHLLSVTRAFARAWPRMAGNLFFAQLLSDVGGMDLYDRGLIAEAYELNAMVEKILDSLNCPAETPLRGDALTILGLCTDNMALSKRQEGLDIRQRCQEIRRLCFRAIPLQDITQDDKIRLYNSYTDLVCSQQQINDFDHVRETLLECFKQYQSWGPEDEQELAYEYAKYYNQMAYVLLWENESENAVEFAKKAYELVERAAPNTGIARLYQSDYAHILFQKGDRHEARDILERLLKLAEQDCGAKNVRTLEIRLNIGIMGYFIEDLPYAEAQIRIAVKIGEEIAGWPEENTVRGKYYLSQALKENSRGNNFGEALELEDEAKEGLHRLLKLDKSGMASRYSGNYPMLFDYLVHWENRLVTPRKEPTAKASATAGNSFVAGV